MASSTSYTVMDFCAETAKFLPLLGSLASSHRTALTLFQKRWIIYSYQRPAGEGLGRTARLMHRGEGRLPSYLVLSTWSPATPPHATTSPWIVWPTSWRLCCIPLSSYGCHLPSRGQSKVRNPAHKLRDTQLPSTIQPNTEQPCSRRLELAQPAKTKPSLGTSRSVCKEQRGLVSFDRDVRWLRKNKRDCSLIRILSRKPTSGTYLQLGGEKIDPTPC